MQIIGIAFNLIIIRTRQVDASETANTISTNEEPITTPLKFATVRSLPLSLELTNATSQYNSTRSMSMGVSAVLQGHTLLRWMVAQRQATANAQPASSGPSHFFTLFGVFVPELIGSC